MKKTLTWLAMAGLFACSNPTAPRSEQEEPIPAPADTVYVNIENQDYTFSLGLVGVKYDNGWAVQAGGAIFNESREDIIGLRPVLRLYESKTDRESNSYLTSNWGRLGRTINVANGYVLSDITDTLKVDGVLNHLTTSDTLTTKNKIFWRFGFKRNNLSKSMQYTDGQFQ